MEKSEETKQSNSSTGYILPKHLQLAIDKVLQQNPEYKTKAGAAGQCIIASDKLMFMYDEIVGEIADAFLSGNDDKLNPHHWAVIDGYCVDLTARQFDETESCPKVWRIAANKGVA